MKRKRIIKAKPPKDGSPFRSQLEVKIWNDIKRKIKSTKKQVQYETEKLSYTLVRYYVPDFILVFNNGEKRFIEAKGYLRPSDRTKMIAVKEAHPELDIRLIFPQDNKLYSKSNTRYSDWCDKHGFPYFIGTTIPNEWLKQPNQRKRRKKNDHH